ncbi:MAG: S8 family serine peptidase [Sphingomonas sp.]|nr:S8 family serine peptidase [Sphingomonas sp.]
MSSLVRNLALAAVAGIALSASAGAQLLGGMALPPVALPPVGLPPTTGNLPVAGPLLQNILAQPAAQQAISPTLDSVSGLSGIVAESGAPTLLELRRLRLQELIRSNRGSVESDGNGLPVRRGIVAVIDPDPVGLQRAAAAGFRITADDRDTALGMRAVSLTTPRGLSAKDGLKLLHKVAPELQADLDHLFEPAGASLLPMAGALAAAQGVSGGPAIGMVDGGVASHPSLTGKAIEQNGFAGSPQPTGHGTAVASLLVGNQGPFRGAAPNARLFVADVYGGNRAAGSATAIVRALGWLSGKRPQVINISLVGPPNKLVQRAIQIVESRGTQVVAAVGNDGPAAPPQYPASYPGVIAVTAVDASGRALPEAGKPSHLDFAAPGADMAAALPGNGFTRVRGTSFAAPLAAARLAAAGSPRALAAEARPGKGRVGRGIVCGACRIDPRSVGAK